MTGVIYLYTFPNGMNYIGQTWDFKRRCSEHKNDCKRRVHDNPIFQRCYDKYGLPTPEVLYRGIETQAELDRLESLCFDRFGSHIKNGGCNIREAGRRGRNSEESKAKMSETALARVADGTHNFQDADCRNNQRVALSESNQQRVADGTHNLLGGQVQRKRWYLYRQNEKARRRELYRIYAALLFTKSLCEIYRTCQLTREGFFDKEIPDTSNAKQQTLF